MTDHSQRIELLALVDEAVAAGVEIKTAMLSA